MEHGNDRDIAVLNAFLRREWAAVESYDGIIGRVETPSVRIDLTENRSSHARRVRLLTAKVHELGGMPVTSSGMWGAFRRGVDGGTPILGLSTALATLEEGEEHGLDDYLRRFSELSHELRAFLSTRIVPEQQTTHSCLARLRQLT